MALVSQPSSRTSLGVMNVGSLQFGLLGRIASPRGVQVVALDGLVNHSGGDQITTTVRAFSHLLQVPAGCTLGVARQGPRPHPPTNFISPGVPGSKWPGT